MAPRPSSVPVGGGGYLDPYGQHAHDSDEYSQCLFRSPSHGNNFIKQLNHGTATNPGTGRFYDPNFPSPAYSSTLSLPSSIPLPPPMPAQFLNDRSSPWSTLQLTDSVREGRSHMHDDLLSPRVDELQQELNQRIQGRVGLINQSSTKADVQRWLTSKHVSPELAQKLQLMNGDQLFRVTKSELDQLTNEEESARLYTLLAQQKKLAGYLTDDAADRSMRPNKNGLTSLKSAAINGADDPLAFRSDASLSRSLKIKLKQRRDKIENAELVPPIVE